MTRRSITYYFSAQWKAPDSSWNSRSHKPRHLPRDMCGSSNLANVPVSTCLQNVVLAVWRGWKPRFVVPWQKTLTLTLNTRRFVMFQFMEMFPEKRGKWHFRALTSKNFLEGGMPPGLSAARAFGAPWTFSTVRTPRKMHATPLEVCSLNSYISRKIYRYSTKKLKVKD